MIQAIETEYDGYLFRSRLEARWAVFFNHLNIPFQYEPEGYYVGWPKHEEDCNLRFTEEGKVECNCVEKRTMYLPDFYLPRSETWVEVKGDWKNFDLQTLADAVDWGLGLPHIDESQGTNRGLLLLGDIPKAEMRWSPAHLILQHSKGGRVGAAVLTNKGPLLMESDIGYFDSLCGPEHHELKKLIREHWISNLGYEKPCHSLIRAAYHSARSARFN